MDASRVSILIPAIRPDKAQRCVEAVRENAGSEHYDIMLWEDTERVGCPWMVRCMTTWAKAPWVCFLGDDTIPQPGFLRIAMQYAKTLPDGWGLVGLNDNVHLGGYPATHWVGHKNLLPLISGEFFNTAYTHCYCDMELTERAEALGRYVWAEEAKVFHDHPLFTGEKMDADYTRVYSDRVKARDLSVYYQRKRKGWQ